MSDIATLLSSFSYTLEGVPASEELVQHITQVTVENSLHLPDVATLVINDPQLRWIDDSRLEPGNKLTVSANFGTNLKPIFDGEIVEIEPVFEDGTQRLTVRAFDRLHRLARGRCVTSFANVTDGDIIAKLAKEVGLVAKVSPTTQVHKYVLQSGQTRLEFLRERAARLGYLLYVEGSTLYCEPPRPSGAAIELSMFGNMFEFRPRLTTIDQVSEVTARGWDVMQKREVIGKAKGGTTAPKIGVPQSGGDLAKKAFSIDASHLVSTTVLRTQSEADQLAKATADRISAHFVEAEGLASGSPQIKAGQSVSIKNVGTRFGGTYFVTSSTHSFTAEEGYRTSFTVSGLQPNTLISLLALPQPATPAQPALVLGVVTDTNDPDNLGRVKVKFPWLSNDHASDWARVVSAGAGPQRGQQMLPEVNDEVLVGFEMGDINHPYVLGGLWNGKDAPPYKSAEMIKGGKVQKRVIRSRTGHEIILDDDESKGGITIKDKNGNQIVLTIEQDKLTITSKGDMTFDAKGKLTLKTGKELSIEATGKGEIKAKGLTVDGQSAATELKGMGVKVEGGTGTVDVKGSMINLN